MTIYFNKENINFYTYKCLVKCYREKVEKINTKYAVGGSIKVISPKGIDKLDKVETRTVHSIIKIIYSDLGQLIDKNNSSSDVVQLLAGIVNDTKKYSRGGVQSLEKYNELYQLVSKYLLNPDLKSGVARVAFF